MRRGSREFESSLQGVPEELRDESWYASRPSVEELSGVSKVICKPEAFVVEAGREHAWSCEVLRGDARREFESVRSVRFLGGRATLGEEWYRVSLYPAKGFCRWYGNLRVLECE